MRYTLFLILLFSSVSLTAQRKLTLLFVGDLMQHKGQLEAARTSDGSYNYSSCFSLVKKQISQADFAIANLEVTLGGKPYTGYPAFSAPDEYLKAIKDAGFDILLTANNHCLDRGKHGLERTVQMLDSLKISHLGTYSSKEQRNRQYPLFIQKNGIRIALLNYTYGTNGIPVKSPNIVNYIDKKQILEDIYRAKEGCPDAIIACMHWGDEYHLTQNREQEKLGEWLINHGVDHVIGSHPHVIQPVVTVSRGKRRHIIAYSLGNYISNMSAPNTDGGMMLTLTLEKSILADTPSFIHSKKWEDSDLVFPYAKLKECHYNLVWVGKPRHTMEKNHIIYPFYQLPEYLSPQGDKALILFKKATRANLKRHNSGVEER